MDASAQLEFLRWALGLSIVINVAMVGALYKHIQNDIDWRDRVARLEGRLRGGDR